MCGINCFWWLSLREFLEDHEGNSSSCIYLYMYICAYTHTHTLKTPVTLNTSTVPYLDNPLSHGSNLPGPSTPLYTHAHAQTHRQETPNICVMLRLPSTGLGKVSIMRWSLVNMLPLTLIFHPLPSSVLFLVIYSYRRVQLMCRWVGNRMLKTITLSLLGQLTSLSSSSSSSSDSGPSSSAGWNTTTAQGLKKVRTLSKKQQQQ